MKIFEITLGTNRHLIVAKDEQDAFERRTEVDQTYDYLPVEVKELKIEGYVIRAEKEKAKNEDNPPAEEKPKVKKKSNK